jgi:hypothetical protein
MLHGSDSCYPPRCRNLVTGPAHQVRRAAAPAIGEKTGEIVEGPPADHRRKRDALERLPDEVRRQMGADPTILSGAVAATLLGVVIINLPLPGLVLLALMLAGFEVLTYRIGTPSFPIGHLGEEQR